MTTNKREADILAYITEHWQQEGYAPTLQDIATALGLSSKGHVEYYLDMLRAKKRITLNRAPRSLNIIETWRQCQFCASRNVKCTSSHSTRLRRTDIIVFYRRRMCLDCGKRWTTYELRREDLDLLLETCNALMQMKERRCNFERASKMIENGFERLSDIVETLDTQAQELEPTWKSTKPRTVRLVEETP